MGPGDELPRRREGRWSAAEGKVKVTLLGGRRGGDVKGMDGLPKKESAGGF